MQDTILFPLWRVDQSLHWTLWPLASTALGWEPMANRVIDCRLDTKEPHSAQALPDTEAGHSGSGLATESFATVQVRDFICLYVKSQRRRGCAPKT
jgi:hypothetical protein